MTNLLSIKERTTLDGFVSDLIAEKINLLLEKQKQVTLAICGGRSVSGIFNLLKMKKIAWDKVHIFMVDERLVPITDAESNFKLANETFLQELLDTKKLMQKNLHPFNFNPKKKDLGMEAYAKELKLFGQYDIVLLSAGEDGHVGALYPGHHSITDESPFFIAMHDSPKPPKDRMSMSKKLLLKSKVAIVLFLGDAKKEALAKFRNPNIKAEDCPCKLVKEIEDSYAVTDLDIKV